MKHLREFRLSAESGSRRVVATCCDTPVFLELKGAHWLSVYLHLWPATRGPTRDPNDVGVLPDASDLPDGVPI